MEDVSTYILLFITLFPPCPAAVTGTWYSANVINDGDFSPKPITELFSSEPPPFSSTNPIVVLSQSTTPPTPISTTVSPGISSSSATSPFTPEFISTYSTPPSTAYTPSTFTPSSTQFTQDPFSQSTYPEPKPTYDLGPQRLPNQFDPNKPNPFDLGQQMFPTQFDQNKPNPPSAPSYILIYQQAQNLPPLSPQQTVSTFQPSSTLNPSSFQPDFSPPQSTFSTFAPDVTSGPASTLSSFQPTSPTTLSTFQPETSTPLSTLFFTPSSESTFPSNLPSSPPTSSPTLFTSTTSTPVVRPTRTSPPCNNTRNSLDKLPTLRIRMVAPSGSITNVNINPIASTTTRRPVTKNTTRKPSTTRTRRTKKGRNTFDGCTRACQDKGRKPICAAPLAQIPVNPNTLKGFPSVCHMACHNSFKNDQYEMLVEGRCGRLRTRIKTVDSDKLTRVELNKAQYAVLDGQTVFEFAKK